MRIVDCNHWGLAVVVVEALAVEALHKWGWCRQSTGVAPGGDGSSHCSGEVAQGFPIGQ